MRKETRVMRNIKLMYSGLNLNQEAVLHKTKLLLKIYRDVVWATLRETSYAAEHASSIFGKREIGAALAYLSDYAPTEERCAFETKVICLFETQ